MSDYRRFVSYIYLYENNIKSMNAGFVKVESRNGQCRLSLSLKNVYSGMGRCNVYLFIRVGQELRGIYIGDAQIKNHGSDWNFRTETGNIANSGYSLDQMSGMIIKGEGDKFYGTRWDQGDLDLHHFVTQWEESTAAGETVREVFAENKIEEQDYKEVEEINKVSDERTMVEEETEDSETIMKEEIAESQAVSQAQAKNQISTMETDERRKNFGKILEQCPGMYPFEDDAIEACVRLEPQDIGMMPLDCWSYGSNSFLLHGYYSYRHLILARLKAKENQPQAYILGVPGTRHSREAFMANMFGFQTFKPIREGNESSSDFGYWYTLLG